MEINESVPGERKNEMSMMEVDKKTFEPEVLQAEGKVLVDFYGDGCVPCAALMPHVHGYADAYGDKIKFCAMNTSKARRVAIGQQVLGLPTSPSTRMAKRSMCWSRKTPRPKPSKK